MYRLAGLFFLLLISAPALAGTDCVEPYTKSPIPPEVRIQVWSKFLQDNPQSPHRDIILLEIDKALAELWGKPICEPYQRDATVNPFKDTPEKAKPTKPQKPLDKDSTFDPFGTINPFNDQLVDPFKSKTTPKSDRPFDTNGTFDPFAEPPADPKSPKGPKGPSKKPLGDFTVDPFQSSSPQAPQSPSAPTDPTPIESDGVLVDPFKKKKSK